VNVITFKTQSLKQNRLQLVYDFLVLFTLLFHVMKKIWFFFYFILSPSSEHHSSDYADDEDENDDEQEVASQGREEQDKKEQPRWTVVCSTEEEWQQLAESFKKSKNKDEKMLYETLSVDFVPEIGKMIEAKVQVLVN